MGCDAIDVVVRPQSVVHPAVLSIDGSLKAQLGTPDMRLPIQYALTHQEPIPPPAGPPGPPALHGEARSALATGEARA